MNFPARSRTFKLTLREVKDPIIHTGLSKQASDPESKAAIYTQFNTYVDWWIIKDRCAESVVTLMDSDKQEINYQ